jgi:hypothetical protein
MFAAIGVALALDVVVVVLASRTLQGFAALVEFDGAKRG